MDPKKFDIHNDGDYMERWAWNRFVSNLNILPQVVEEMEITWLSCLEAAIKQTGRSWIDEVQNEATKKLWRCQYLKMHIITILSVWYNMWQQVIHNGLELWLQTSHWNTNHLQSIKLRKLLSLSYYHYYYAIHVNLSIAQFINALYHGPKIQRFKSPSICTKKSSFIANFISTSGKI